jgi:peroxiredoxin
MKNKHTIMKKFLLAVVALFLSVSAFAELPSVQLKDIDGKRVDTAKLNNDGKPYIISFFATWCKPCLRELDAVNEVYADWQEETGVKLIAVSIDKAQDESKVKPLVNSKGYEYQVLLDPNGDFKRAMGVNMVPTVFIIDGKNNIVETRTQYTDGSEEHLIEAVRALLKK